MNRPELESRIRSFIQKGCEHEDEREFDFLASELFVFQFENNSFYRAFSDRLGKNPANVRLWRAIPCLPVSAFKLAYVSSFPSERAISVFRTSGTTDPERGQLFLDDFSLYELSLATSFKYFCLPDLDDITMASLIPSFRRASDSSLSYMISTVFSAFGSHRSAWFFEGEKPDYGALVQFLMTMAGTGEPVMLLGTAIGFLDFLDYCSSHFIQLHLPPRSRLMETGGSKGRKRKISTDDLYSMFKATFGLERQFCINEYGMTEMGSQFYDSSLRQHFFGSDGDTEKVAPPWARTRVIDPISSLDADVGREGILCHIDLANAGSVLALETEDLGVKTGGGFEIVDRIPASGYRGCSLAMEEKLYP